MGRAHFPPVSGGWVSARLRKAVRWGRFRRNVQGAGVCSSRAALGQSAAGGISRSRTQFWRSATLRVGRVGDVVGRVDISRGGGSHITQSASVGVLMKPSRRVILVMGESARSGHCEMGVVGRSSGKPYQTSRPATNSAASVDRRPSFVGPCGWYTRSSSRMEYLVTLRCTPSARLRTPGGSGVLGWHSAAWSTRARAQRSITNGWVGHGPSRAGLGGTRLRTVAREEPT